MKEFMTAAAVRAVRTMAQTAISVIGIGAAMTEVDWLQVGSAAALSGILSVLTSLTTGLPEVPAHSERK